MPLVQTRGAASAQGFGEFAQSAAPIYIEDVFSTYLYTGNGSTQTITNGIDLSTKGGLVWIKGRNGAGEGHTLFDTARGVNQLLQTQNTDASANFNNSLTAFNTNGFSLGTNRTDPSVNYVSWTFREQPKFFDIVTYTGNGINGRAISHNLGSVPGCIIVKRTDGTSNWVVYHRSLSVPTNKALRLNSTSAELTSPYFPTTPTSTVFYTNGDGYEVNTTGQTYIAYLFAHDAGGFGLTGTDNVISCGDYTCVAYPGDVTVTLGYEPQWVMVKNATQASNWVIYDIMRGMPGTTAVNPVTLAPDSNAAENGVTGSAPGISPTATGFIARAGLTAVSGSSGDKVIYIACRRGPMKVPTTGTSVYNAIVRNGTQANATVTGVGFPVDLDFTSLRPAGTHNPVLSDRLRGAQTTSSSRGAQAEQSEPIALTSFASMDGVSYGADNTGFWNGFNSEIGLSYVNWFFKRAPSFFDVVCYTGTGSATTFSHNLQAVPELMIVKRRSAAADWSVYSSALGNNKYLSLNDTIASSTTATYWNNTTPTSSVFTVGTGNQTNGSGSTYVAYLFATCAGVSKVGSYTGTGTTQTINCGFTAGSRFIMIKRTDSTGDWYVWDSARGIIAGNDPYLLINDTAAEVTGTDYVDTANSGFEISSTAPAGINANGGTYIFLAIA